MRHAERFRKVGHRLEARCTRCLAWKDAKRDFHWRRTGPGAPTPRHWCKDCRRLYENNGQHPYVAVATIRPFLTELVNRLGKAETLRRINRSTTWLWCVENNQRSKVQRETARLILTALRAAREKDEVRHYKSIRAGAAMRGYQERIPKDPRDYYQRDWD